MAALTQNHALADTSPNCGVAAIVAAHDFPRPRSVHRPIDPVTFVLQSGGRWERLLAPLCEGVLTQSELMQATNPGIHARKVERCRIRRALDTMRTLGLVESIPGFGWTATVRGRDQLHALNVRSEVRP